MDNFAESRLYKVLDGTFGLVAITFSLIVFVILFVIYAIRTCQSRKNLFSEFYSYLTGDGRPTARNSRSITAKFFRVTVFLLLAAGFMGVVYYNVNKMLTDDPLITVTVEDNIDSPSILCCTTDKNPIQSVLVGYYDNLAQQTYEGNIRTLTYNLTDSVTHLIIGKGENQTPMNCVLFNRTLSTKPKEKIGGVYVFTLSSVTDVFIGEFNSIDENISYPQGSAHSNIGMQFITNPVTHLTYEETRYKELDGGKIHRSYQFSLIGSYVPAATAEVPLNLFYLYIIAPNSIITNVEEPPLDLAVFFGNIGGYLTICGIFGFLFGNGKMNPFGFVTEYCFQYKDLENNSDKVGNDFEKGHDKDRELESKFETLLKKYYVDVERFKTN